MHGPPPSGTREQLHVHDLVIALAEVEAGEPEAEVTAELLAGYPPVPREQALAILERIRAAVDAELARCAGVVDAATAAPVRRRASGHPVLRLAPR